MTLTIVGLGPGHIDDLSRRAWRALDTARTVYLRTGQHPTVPHLPPHTHYIPLDDAPDGITRVLDVAQLEDVVYAVPGDPLVGDDTVTRLLALAHDAGLTVKVVSGISVVEPALRLLGVNALGGLQVLDGASVAAMHHPPINPDTAALLAHVRAENVPALKRVLLNQYPDTFEVTLLHDVGSDDARVERIALSALDSAIVSDALLFIPALGGMSSFQRFEEIIAHLRAPEGCPWDKKQTHESLRPYMLEEAHEALEAIDNGDWQALSEELGDVLLQVVLHTQIAVDKGEFRMTDVLRHVNNKLVRRHPHVWGTTQVDGAEQVLANWDTLKKQEHAEKGTTRESLLDGVPKGLPALMQAYQYRQKAAKIGFDWEKLDDVTAKVREEMEEIITARDAEHVFEEVGDLLFALVNWAHWLGVKDPESALRETNAKFYRRFRYVEEHVNGAETYPLEQLDALWNEAKAMGL